MDIQIKDVGNCEYEAIDPTTKGKWLIKSKIPLSEIGVIYAMIDSLSRDNSRPGERFTRTVEFEFKSGTLEDMSEFQKAFLGLSNLPS